MTLPVTRIKSEHTFNGGLTEEWREKCSDVGSLFVFSGGREGVFWYFTAVSIMNSRCKVFARGLSLDCTLRKCMKFYLVFSFWRFEKKRKIISVWLSALICCHSLFFDTTGTPYTYVVVFT